MIDIADLPPTLTVPEAAELLGCSGSALYEAIKADARDAAAREEDEEATDEAERPRCPVKVLRIGRKIVVPTWPLLEALGLAEAGELHDPGPRLSVVGGGADR